VIRLKLGPLSRLRSNKRVRETDFRLVFLPMRWYTFIIKFEAKRLYAVLAILISFTQIASPWLCCCSPLIAKTRLQQEQSENNKSCCKHCCHDSAGKPASDQSKPAAPKNCQCLEHSVVSAPQKAIKWDFPLNDSLPKVSFHSPRYVETVIRYVGQRLTPQMTAKDKLYEHHVLRC
jgi:hypothetical protein